MTKNKDSLLEKDVAGSSEQNKLMEELKNSRYETIKYVNKFLESEEKWKFINLLLKKMNSMKDKHELCKSVCDGLLKLTLSRFCACIIFNPDTKTVEFKKAAFEQNSTDRKKATEFIANTNKNCCEFLKKTSTTEEVSEYFITKSTNEIILSPITYNEIFYGYLLLVKEDSNFYQNNINHIDILSDHLALILENISIYQDSEKRNKDKIELLAGISHEFKTPLNAIIGFSELLKTRSQNINDFKYIENISRSSKHLHSLIEDILDVSKYEMNKLELNYSFFNTKDAITQTISTLEEMCKEKNIDLSYTLTDISITADAKRFRQLIYNLVTNAIKFNKENGKITIFTYITDGNFIFEITDTGDGIRKKDSDKIFDFFSQVNQNQLKRQLGSGIGLALCKIITDAHLGTINFKSEIKKGSCFWFELPLKRPGRFD